LIQKVRDDDLSIFFKIAAYYGKEGMFGYFFLFQISERTVLMVEQEDIIHRMTIRAVNVGRSALCIGILNIQKYGRIYYKPKKAFLQNAAFSN